MQQKCDCWSWRLFISWHTWTFSSPFDLCMPSLTVKNMEATQNKPCLCWWGKDWRTHMCFLCLMGFWGDLLLTQEWKPQIKMFVLTKDKWDFSFAQTMQDCVGLLKVSGKNCLLVDTSDETWNMHKIKTCMLLQMFRMFLWKKEAEEVRKEMEEENREMLLISSMYRYSMSIEPLK